MLDKEVVDSQGRGGAVESAGESGIGGATVDQINNEYLQTGFSVLQFLVF